MIRPAIITTIIALFMLAACNPSHLRKPGRKMLIPENKMVDILTDTYLTSGMLEINEIRDTWGQRDSILNYIDVIKSHGYTYEQFETTLKYYFSGKPKKMARIYDRVTGNLQELEVRIMTEKGTADTLSVKNLWTGSQTYSLPEDFTRDPVWFDIPIEYPGTYVLRADIMIFEDDKSFDPRVTVFFSTFDSLGNERRSYWEEVRLPKNGEYQTIEIRNKIDSAKNARIRGWLLNHTNQQGIWEKHARIKDISLILEKESFALPE